MTGRADNLRTLEQTHLTLAEMTAGLRDDTLDFRTGLDEWSIREILAHLVDDEMYVMRLRMERIIKEDQPDLTPHDEKKWHAGRNTTRDRLVELLGDFALQRTASLGLLRMLRESDWAREGFQPEYGKFTADGWLDRWVEHDRVHVKQVEGILAAWEKQKA